MNTSNTVRYGLIGAGMMGREHIRNLALVPGAVVTAVSDPDQQQRELSAREAGDAAAFADHHALLKSGLVDALVIASPNDTHAAILQDIFGQPHKLPILVEKPLCTNATDATSLASSAAAYGAPIWVAMEYRYMPAVAALVQEVHAGTIGALQMFAIREHRYPFLPKVGDWNRFNRRTGGTLVEKCCHFFDLMRLVMRMSGNEDEAVRVYASGAANVNHRDERYGGQVPDIIDNAYVIVDFKSGRRAMLDLCMFAEGSFWQEEMAATGDRGKVEALVPGPARLSAAERPSELVISPRHPKGPQRREFHVDANILRAGDHNGSTFHQHIAFNRVVRGEGTVEVSIDDGIKAVLIGLAAEQSAREHVAVDIQAA